MEGREEFEISAGIAFGGLTAWLTVEAGGAGQDKNRNPAKAAAKKRMASTEAWILFMAITRKEKAGIAARFLTFPRAGNITEPMEPGGFHCPW
jgi:hypothetical protein